MIKKEKGITLVALVITIIVLLILAGVTIAMVVGDNGILTRSKQSKFNTQVAELDEKVGMFASDLAAEFQTDLATNTSGGYKLNKTDIQKVWDETVKESDGWSATETTAPDNSAADAVLHVKYTSDKLKGAAKDASKADQEWTITIKKNFDVTCERNTSNNGGYSTK